MLRNNKPFLGILLVFLFLSCDKKILHEFRNVNNEWLRSDTLTFSFCNKNESAIDYTLRIELRNIKDYNYKDLSLRVEARSKSYLSPIVDTVICNILDDNGVYEGVTAGIMYQSASRSIHLPSSLSDTLYLKINHLMGDTLNGISDVGVRLQRCGRHLSSEN